MKSCEAGKAKAKRGKGEGREIDPSSTKHEMVREGGEKDMDIRRGPSVGRGAIFFSVNSSLPEGRTRNTKMALRPLSVRGSS